jgi:hypothetical protein
MWEQPTEINGKLKILMQEPYLISVTPEKAYSNIGIQLIIRLKLFRLKNIKFRGFFYK